MNMSMVHKIIVRISVVAVLTVMAVGGFQGAQLLSGNFHTVVPGEMYRSAQLKSGDILHYQEKYHVAAVLNLRGNNLGAGWYDKEVAEAQQAGVEHIDFRMSAQRELTPAEAMHLIEVMRDAPKPLLIHCQAGADRTGLAAAFYVAAIAKGGEWAAERQLWMQYGHLPLWINASYAMNRTFERLEPYLGFTNS